MIENGTKVDPIADMIKKHEGCRLKLYSCPAGKMTVGYGRNIEDNGITQEEADLMFLRDYEHAKADAILFVGTEHWPDLSHARQAVLIDMAFNLGNLKLMQFKGFRKALQEERWQGAAMHMRSSLWATQVKGRALRLIKMMERGEWS